MWKLVVLLCLYPLCRPGKCSMWHLMTSCSAWEADTKVTFNTHPPNTHRKLLGHFSALHDNFMRVSDIDVICLFFSVPGPIMVPSSLHVHVASVVFRHLFYFHVLWNIQLSLATFRTITYKFLIDGCVNCIMVTSSLHVHFASVVFRHLFYFHVLWNIQIQINIGFKYIHMQNKHLQIFRRFI